MRNAIIRVWNGEARYLRWLFYVPLFLLSTVYRYCLEVRTRIYDRGWIATKGVSVPVISVGNITTGGVGKTPLVIWLVKALEQKGFKVVVLSRGYKASQGLNDEAKMFK